MLIPGHDLSLGAFNNVTNLHLWTDNQSGLLLLKLGYLHLFLLNQWRSALHAPHRNTGPS